MKGFYTQIKPFALIFLAIVLSLSISAQETQKETTSKTKAKPSFDKYLYLGGNVGATFLFSDVSESKPASLGGGGYLGWQFSKWLSIRGELNSMVYRGENSLTADPDKYLPELIGKKTEGYTYESVGVLVFEIDDIIKYNPDRWWGFYLTAGAGLAQFQTHLFDLDDNIVGGYTWGVKDTPREGKGIDGRRFVGMVPVGAGFKVNLTEKLDVRLESSMRFLDTDALDGKTAEIDQTITTDYYNYTSLGLAYSFKGGGNLKSMKNKFDEVQTAATPDPLETVGDDIAVTIAGTFPEKYFNKKAAVLMQPVLVTATGDSVMLKSMTFRGEKTEGGGSIVNYAAGTSYEYTDVVAYTPDMSSSELFVTYTAYLPKEPVNEDQPLAEITEAYKNLELGTVKVADGVINTCKQIMSQDLTDAYEPSMYEKQTIVTESYHIFFPVNLANINFRFGMNSSQGSKDNMKEVTAFVEKGWDIKDVTVMGWASPEGEETFNEGLSEKRAKIAEKYMMRKMRGMLKSKDATLAYSSVDDITFTAKGNGPDWNGFMKRVENSDMSDKNIIMNIVNSSNPAKREQEIRNMILVYPELEETILPPLRRTEVAVNCYEPKKTEAEIAELAMSDPAKLDEKEIMYAAEELAPTTDAKMKIYKNAISVYPQLWQAYNNAACCAVDLGNVGEAKALLTDAAQISPDQASVYNNLGKVAAIEGDFDTAKEYFMKAKKLGMNENYNLGALTIRDGKYDEALSLMSNKKCDHNTGLAQMLKGDFNAAKTTLECAPESAETFYVMAILGSRMDDSAYIYVNLIKAVEMNQDNARRAAIDREFIKYYNEPNFQSIVQ